MLQDSDGPDGPSHYSITLYGDGVVFDAQRSTAGCLSLPQGDAIYDFCTTGGFPFQELSVWIACDNENRPCRVRVATNMRSCLEAQQDGSAESTPVDPDEGATDDASGADSSGSSSPDQTESPTDSAPSSSSPASSSSSGDSGGGPSTTTWIIIGASVGGALLAGGLHAATAEHV